MEYTQIRQIWEKYLLIKDSNSTQATKYKDILIQYYYPYMKNISNKTAKSIQWKQTSQELSSYAAQGLIKSIQKFDLTKNVKFQTYAFRKIRGAILDGLRQQDWVPRSVRKNHENIEGARARLQVKLQRRPSDEQVFEQLGLDFSQYTKCIGKFTPKGNCSIQNSINPQFSNNSNKSFNSNLIQKCISPMSSQMRKDFFIGITKKCRLNQIEINILLLYYYHNLTMKQISIKMKMSQSRISQMHKSIINTLNKQLNQSKQDMFDDVKQMFKTIKQS